MLAVPPSDADGSDSVSSSSSSSSWFSHLRHTVRAALSDLEILQGNDQSASSAGSVPSKLPAGHSSNDCNPCVLFATQRGCFRGGSCNYCHEQHLDKPKVAKRLGCVSVSSCVSGVRCIHACMCACMCLRLYICLSVRMSVCRYVCT